MSKISMFIIAFVLVYVSSSQEVFANGLFVNQSSINITKIAGNDLIYNFNITNKDSFTFYNISIEPNNLISMPIINQLNPGQIASVNVLILANESFSLRKFRILGYYYTNVGVSNVTHEINVDYYNGLTKCDFTAIKGDKVKWTNKVSDDIDLKNVVTGNVVTTIQQNNSYTTNFDNPEIFKYTFLRRGFSFVPICTITVISDNGLVNNPELDSFVNISLNMIYNPTNLSYVILEKNYTSNVYQSQDGILTLTNNGNQTARNIILSGEWFSFNANDFNLEPGQTKGIVYTIRPILTATSETNKSHTKKLTISGNFPTITESFNIFVRYANLNDSNQTGNYQSLLALLQEFCEDNPNEVFCKDKPTIVYVGNGTDTNFNVSYSQDQVKKIWDYIFKMGDDEVTVNNWLKENVNQMSLSLNEMKNITLDNSNRLNNLETERQKSAGSTTMIIIIFMMVGLGVLIVVLIFVELIIDPFIAL